MTVFWTIVLAGIRDVTQLAVSPTGLTGVRCQRLDGSNTLVFVSDHADNPTPLGQTDLDSFVADNGLTTTTTHPNLPATISYALATPDTYDEVST